MIIYQAVTADEYELPIAQADTLLELATILDVSYACLRKQYFRQQSGKNIGYKILKIEI